MTSWAKLRCPQSSVATAKVWVLKSARTVFRGKTKDIGAQLKLEAKEMLGREEVHVGSFIKPRNVKLALVSWLHLREGRKLRGV